MGPKLQSQLAATGPNLERTVDYGLLMVIAQPLFKALNWVHGVVGNWGWAIIIVTALIKLIFFPLSQASGRSMAKMRAVAPRMKQIQESFKDDREKLGRAMMELYKKEKINPLAGCLPMVVQIPVFISFYWVLSESVEMRQAPFLLWINDLSSRDPYFVLPLLMGGAMFAQFKLNPAPPDPMQAKIMQFMPLVMTGTMAWFPSGLVLYWLTNTVLSIAQQWRINQVVTAQTPSVPDARTPPARRCGYTSRGLLETGRAGERKRHHRRHRQLPRAGARSGSCGCLGRRCPADRARHARRRARRKARAAYAVFSTPTARRSIEGLALYFPAPASFTGEHVLELQGHGGALVMDLLLRRAARARLPHGAAGRVQRARFLERQDGHRAGRSGRRSDRCGHRAPPRGPRCARCRASSRRTSKNSARCSPICAPTSRRRSIFRTRRSTFSPGPAIATRLERVFAAFDAIEAAAAQGALLREGSTVVIAGKPNAGKSSLLNRLVGDEVAIVTPAPGTTRDVLRQHVSLDGLPVNLIDTAGLRRAQDEAEEEGIRRAHAEMQRADRILYVVDASAPDAAAESEANADSASAAGLPSGVPLTLVINKIDLTGATGPRLGGDTAADFLERSNRLGDGPTCARISNRAPDTGRPTPARSPRGVGISTHSSAPAASRRARPRGWRGASRSSCSRRICGSLSARSARSPAK